MDGMIKARAHLIGIEIVVERLLLIPDLPLIILLVSKLLICAQTCVYLIMESRGKFGECSRRERIAGDVAERNSGLLNALSSRLHLKLI